MKPNESGAGRVRREDEELFFLKGGNNHRLLITSNGEKKIRSKTPRGHRGTANLLSHFNFRSTNNLRSGPRACDETETTQKK
jgi:hypothetical protein